APAVDEPGALAGVVLEVEAAGRIRGDLARRRPRRRDVHLPQLVVAGVGELLGIRGPEDLPFFRRLVRQPLALAGRELEHPDLLVARLVRDVGDLLAVWRVYLAALAPRRRRHRRPLPDSLLARHDRNVAVEVDRQIL